MINVKFEDFMLFNNDVGDFCMVKDGKKEITIRNVEQIDTDMIGSFRSKYTIKNLDKTDS